MFAKRLSRVRFCAGWLALAVGLATLGVTLVP